MFEILRIGRHSASKDLMQLNNYKKRQKEKQKARSDLGISMPKLFPVLLEHSRSYE
jgi:hypothetical protein